jgi:hypothetical protein
MHLYPEVDVPMTESWHASKWLAESSVDEDAPMWADWDDPARSHRHYFIHELAITENDSFVLIMRWITVG